MKGYMVELQKFASNGPGSYGARQNYRLPPWLYTNATARDVLGASLWNQADANGATGAVTIGIDHGGVYATEGNYPLEEKVLPIEQTPLVALQLPSDKRYAINYLPEPVQVREEDVLTVATEFSANGSLVYPFLNLAIGGDYTVPYGAKTVLALRGKTVGGQNIVRDWSRSNHQVQAVGAVTIPNDPAPPAAASLMQFSGGYLTWRDRPMDFQWTGAFSFEADFQTSDPSLGGLKYRSIFTGTTGNPPYTNHLGEQVYPAHLFIQTDGKIAFELAGQAPHLVSAQGYANGQVHHVRVERGGDMIARLYIDNVLACDPVQDLRQYSASTPVIGMSAINGQWNGGIGNVIVTRN